MCSWLESGCNICIAQIDTTVVSNRSVRDMAWLTLSSSLALNSTKAAWTSSRGGAGRLLEEVGFGIDLGVLTGGGGIGRGTGVADGPPGVVCEGNGGLLGIDVTFCIGVL